MYSKDTKKIVWLKKTEEGQSRTGQRDKQKSDHTCPLGHGRNLDFIQVVKNKHWKFNERYLYG